MWAVFLSYYSVRYVQAPAESRVQREKQCREENQKRQVPTEPEWMSQVASFW